MTIEEMKSAIRKMNEDSWHTRNLDEVYRLYADEIVFHRPPFPPVKSKQANRESDEGMLSAFLWVNHLNIAKIGVAPYLSRKVVL